MKTLISKHIIFIGVVGLLFFITPGLKAQKVIQISGRVVDAITKKALPFVNIILVGKNQGTMTNYEGYYKLSVPADPGKIGAQSIGYKKLVKPISGGENRVLNFSLYPQSVNLNEVVVAGKRMKYRNKGNPAVALIRKVIHNKKLNRRGSLNFYQFNKYDKIEFAFNKSDIKLLKNNAFKKFRFAFHYADTSELTGEPYLPFFLKETTSKVFYRKTPRSQKEYITGTKISVFPRFYGQTGI